MNIRLKKLGQHGFDHVMAVVVFVVLFALVGTFLLLESRAATPSCVNNTNTGSNRCVNLHFGSTGGHCLNGTTLTGCSNTSNDNMWINPVGSNFKLQNKNGQCLSEPGGHVQQKTISQGGHRYPVALVSCSSSYTNWNWAGGKLQNTSGERGCINSVNGNSTGSQIVMYNCGASNETWKSVYVTKANSGGGSGGGGGVKDDGSSTACTHSSNEASDVAYCAVSELKYWNSHPSQHGALITKYCNGFSACIANAWCAGFTSFVFKASGHSVGDVYLAYNFKTLRGLTFEPAGNGYRPKIGDLRVTTGAGDGHIGIVVNASGPQVVEGNYASAVSYVGSPPQNVGDGYLVGYVKVP